MPERSRILIAEDHPIVCSGLTELIDSTDDLRVVSKAHTTEEVIYKTETLDIDLLLLDLGLPGAGGLWVIKYFRNKIPSLKILVLSVQHEEVFGVFTLRAGALGYVNKISTPDIILKAIRTVLSNNYFALESTMKNLNKTVKEKMDNPLSAILSGQEFQVVLLVIKGLNNKEIAQLLNIDGKTVYTYIDRIKRKLNVDNRIKIIDFARQCGITPF